MKTLFIALGSIMVISLLCLFVSVFGLMLFAGQPMLTGIEVCFTVFTLSSAMFITLLVAIPHGRVTG